MSVLVALLEAADIAFHAVADEGWGVPAPYAEGFEILAHNRVISLDLARRMTQVSSVRNRLAHGYATVDAARLWTELPAGLSALDDYAAAIATDDAKRYQEAQVEEAVASLGAARRP